MTYQGFGDMLTNPLGKPRRLVLAFGLWIGRGCRKASQATSTPTSRYMFLVLYVGAIATRAQTL